VLGYQPHRGLKEGLRMLLEWYRSQDASPEQLLRDEILRNWDLNPAVRG
jgi:hypothetical protein